MKNLLKTIALTLALSVAVSLTACNGSPCASHIDENSDGICDNCDKEINTEPDAVKGNKVGDICHSYDLDLLLEDGTVNISDYRGKIVILNFWFSGCSPCRSEMPHFNEVANTADDVVVIAVHSANAEYDTDEYNVETKLPGTKMIFAIDEPLGNTDKYYSLLGGNGSYPFTLILDADGIITFKQVGAISSLDELEALIDMARG